MTVLQPPVLFVDIDGVLKIEGDRELTRANLVRLHALQKTTRCSFVLSSDWRLFYDLATVVSELCQAGYPGSLTFVGTTPDYGSLGAPRGLEIAGWLAGQAPHTPTTWAVVDDRGDMTAVSHRWVRAYSRTGLDDAVCMKLQELLLL